MTNAQKGGALAPWEVALAFNSWVLKLFQGNQSSTSSWTNVGEIKCSLFFPQTGIQESILSISNTFIQSGGMGSWLPVAQKPTSARARLLSLSLVQLTECLLLSIITSWPGALLDARYRDQTPRFPSHGLHSSFLTHPTTPISVCQHQPLRSEHNSGQLWAQIK